MTRGDGPGPDRVSGSRPARTETPAGDEATLTLPVPELAERVEPPQGDADRGPEVGGTLTVQGRRVLVEVGPDGIRDIWAYPFRVSGPRILGTGPGTLTGSALRAVRRLRGDGAAVTEGVVASRDSPVAWVEWSTDGERRLELQWRVAACDPAPAVVVWRTVGPRGWQAATGGRAGSQALFVLSREPDDLSVREEKGGLRVRARVRVPGEDGLRLAIVAARAGDDLTRLSRVADRPGIAVRARKGAVDRVRQEGLSVAASDAALGPAVERGRIGLALGPVVPVGPWTAAGLAATGLDQLASGGFEAARGILEFLIGHGQAGDGRFPIHGVGPAVTGRSEPGAGAEWLPLLARYLAWTGDLAVVGRWWPAVRGHSAHLGSAAGHLAAVAEDLGDARAAAVLRGREPRDAEADREPVSGGSAIRRVVDGLLGAEPDAVRGRLVLRPRLSTLTRLEVRGLAAGPAAVDVAWQRHEAGYQVEVRQGRGPAPLQLVLEPVVAGRAVTAVRVDGRPAELDRHRTERPAERDGPAQPPETEAPGGTDGNLWCVPVQLVLDRPRTLGLEVDPG